MDFKQGMQLRQAMEQRLVMTQQLQQAIKLLQLSRAELADTIADALNENPLLEEAPPADVPHDTIVPGLPGSDGQAADMDAPVKAAERQEIDWQSYFTDLARGPSEGGGLRGGGEDEERPALANTLTRGSTLSEYLDEQIGTSQLTPKQRDISQEIIGNLDDDGYYRPSRLDIEGGAESTRRQFLRQAEAAGIEREEARGRLSLFWLDDEEMAAWTAQAEQKGCRVETFYANSTRAVAKLYEVTEPEVREVLDFIRTLDPAGVASRDLRECLLVQARQIHPQNKKLHRLIEEHLPNLEARNYPAIRKDLRVQPDEVERLLKVLSSLEPRPGRRFIGESARYITPDVSVLKIGDNYTVVVNEDGLPRLRLSKFYQNALMADGQSEAKEYLTEKMRAATWMIRSIQQRQSTIQRVTESIMKFQRPFLDFGVEKLRPLVLRDVAEDVGLHESTISRVTTNKYVHTPQGIYELKFFFNSRIQAYGGDDMASEAVKQSIKKLIDKENPDAPLSDQEIAEILQGDWDRGKLMSRLVITEMQVDAVKPPNPMTIARRTVAKYREAMNIPPSSKRRKAF